MLCLTTFPTPYPVILKLSAVLETETSKKTKHTALSKTTNDKDYFKYQNVRFRYITIFFSDLKKVGDIRQKKLENFWSSTWRNH